MDKDSCQQLIEAEVQKAMDSMFPHGAGSAPHTRVQHWLETVAQYAFNYGRSYALLNLLTVEDVAEQLGVTRRRASEIIRNRHKRFGVGMRFGSSWLIHSDELPQLEPDEKYRTK